MQAEACIFIIKETLVQTFSCKFCEISKNTFCTDHLLKTASVAPIITPEFCQNSFETDSDHLITGQVQLNFVKIQLFIGIPLLLQFSYRKLIKNPYWARRKAIWLLPDAFVFANARCFWGELDQKYFQIFFKDW